MPKHSHKPFAPAATNENRDHREDPTGAYFYLLRVRADLLAEPAAGMTPEYYARWRAAVEEVEGVMRKVRPYL